MTRVSVVLRYSLTLLLAASLALVGAGTTGPGAARAASVPVASRFHGPQALTTDPRGNVYVADAGTGRIFKLSPSGRTLAVWGRRGEFSGPQGLALDRHGDLLVADTGHNQIVRLSPSGRELVRWGGRREGRALGQFAGPSGLTIDAAGHVLVAEGTNSRVQALTPAGRGIRAWGGPSGSVQGWMNGRFRCPYMIATAASGQIYVGDACRQQIDRLSPQGRTLGSFGGAGQLGLVHGLAVNRDSVYVADAASIVRYSLDGKRLLTRWPIEAGPMGTVGAPAGIATDRFGHVFATGDNTIQVYNPGGKRLAVWR